MAFVGLSKPKQQRLLTEPAVGDHAPPIPSFEPTKPYTCLVFLRHVGCPFAEATVRHLRREAAARDDMAFIVISHGKRSATRRWLSQIGGLPVGSLLILDPERRIYGAWGVGYSSAAHFLGPKSLFGLLKLAPQGIRNRSASGTRWQRAATFIVDWQGRVIWKHMPCSAHELPLLPPSLGWKNNA